MKRVEELVYLNSNKCETKKKFKGCKLYKSNNMLLKIYKLKREEIN